MYTFFSNYDTATTLFSESKYSHRLNPTSFSLTLRSAFYVRRQLRQLRAIASIKKPRLCKRRTLPPACPGGLGGRAGNDRLVVRGGCEAIPDGGRGAEADNRTTYRAQAASHCPPMDCERGSSSDNTILMSVRCRQWR
jgi:hypothetical protein